MTHKDTKFSEGYDPNRGDPTEAGKANADRLLLTNALRLALHREVKDADGKPTKRLTQIVEKLAKNAGDGDTASIKEVFDRTEGKAAQALILQGDEDKPISVVERIIVKAGVKDGD